ncbi:hypothetical protein RyT2_18420 [Pseudolactococcus yaeyamensis]
MVKLFFRDIIFIGETASNAIYFDTKNKLILKAPKNPMLDMKQTKSNNIYSILLITIMPILFVIIGKFIAFCTTGSEMYYDMTVLFCLLLVWFSETVILSIVVEKALYGPIKNIPIEQLEKATKTEFRQAHLTNNIWNIFRDKKVTLDKKIRMFLFIAVMLVLGLSTITITPYMIETHGGFLGHKVGSEIIGLSLLGFLPFSVILLLWINNPFRWLNVVEKYQKRKLEK